MLVDLIAYRAAIGLFNCLRISTSSFHTVSNQCCFIFSMLLAVLFMVYINIILANDVELNPGPFKSLKFGHLNCRSLNNEDKFNELSFIVKDYNFHIFALTETWLNNNISSDNFKIPGFNPIIRLDREGRVGGGVALFAVDSLVVKRRHNLEIVGLEFLWVEFSASGSNFLCGVCYRPPDDNIVSCSHFFDSFQKMLDIISLSPNKYKIVILGDFNAHYNEQIPGDSTEIGKQLHRFLESNNLAQLISEPTRVTQGNSTILDLLITDCCMGEFSNTGIISPPLNCDHSIICGEINNCPQRSPSFKRDVWNFNDVNITNLNQELEHANWSQYLENETDIDVIYSKWYRKFRSIIEKHIPLKSVTIRPNDKPWMNGLIRLAIRKRNRFLKKHIKHPTLNTWERYRAQRNQTNYLIREGKKSYYEKVNRDLSDSTINNKKWWAIVKRIYGAKKPSIPALIENNVAISDPVHKAQLFNEYFISQTELIGSDNTPPFIVPFQNSKFISDIVATTQEVLILMRNLDKSKACGHDGIGNKIINLCREGFCVFFTNFINLAFKIGKFPSQWKLANVIPLFKKENRQYKVNYRPVSLLSSFSKICEKIVFDRLYNFLIDIVFLYKYQSGFRPGDSTINQLIYIIHQIYLAFEEGKEVRVVFLDISKAFDRVWHAGLIEKLKAVGVRGPLLMWIESYLKDRKQRVTIEGHSSDWAGIKSGVPQGSVLGPLLFLIYINDITTDLDSSPFIYADDTMLFEIVQNVNVSAANLNEDLTRISDWSKKWLVTMNPSKCQSIIFSLKLNKPDHPALLMDGACIIEVESHAHLGLIFQNNMSWRSHIHNIFEKASKRLNMLKLIKYKVNRSTLTCLYKSLIRPLMEYGDVIWDNCSEIDSKLLDSIQYDCAKVVTGAIKGTSARALMNELGWENLSVRRKMHKLNYFYKITKHISPSYLVDVLPITVGERVSCSLRSNENISSFLCRTMRFRQSFFLLQ